MQYIAAVDFFDLQDNNRLYHTGESFPRDGLLVSDARIKELATDKNRMGYPLIKAVEQDESEKPEEAPKRTSRKRVKKDAD